jgi:hypothetical protein
MATEFISNSWLMPTNANAEANRVSNYSLDFDGSSSKITFSAITLASSYTISAWAKRDSASNNEFLLGNNATFGYGAYFNGTNAIYFKQDSGNTTFNNSAITTALARTDWVNWVFVKDSSAGTIAIYVDGTLAQSVTSSLGMTNLTAIGGDGTASTNYIWNGNITEVSIFDYSLTDGTGGTTNQIGELYGTGSAIGNPMAITNGRKPVAYYPLSNAAFNGEFLVPNGAEKDYVFDFSGTNYINCANDSSLQITGALTVSVWFKILNNSGNRALVTRDTGSTQRNWSLYITSTGTLKLLLRNNTDTGWNIVESSSAFDDGKWHQGAFVYTPSTSLILYVDGVAVDTNTTSITSSINNETADFTIGAYSPNQSYTGDRWIGQISNVATFNTALPATGAESVASLYNYGTPPNIASYSGLQGWWELDASATFDGSNWSIPDASSNSNTGTSSGMTASNLVQSDLIINQSYDPFSLSFDGTDDRVGFTSSIDLGTINTISLWLKNEVSQDRIFLGEDSYLIDYHILGGYNHFIVRVGGSYNVLSTGTVPIIPIASNWSHVVFIRNGDDVSLYINGYLSASSNTWTGGSPSSNASKFDSIGAKPTGGTSWLGKISNVSAFNSALSAAQVKTLYNEGKPFNLNNFAVTPVSWWRLGAVNSSFDGTNWTVLDEIGTNNGTSANMTQSDLVDGVGATGSGTSSGMSSGTNRTGDAPYSDNNAVSYNMSVTAKSTSVPT